MNSVFMPQDLRNSKTTDDSALFHFSNKLDSEFKIIDCIGGGNFSKVFKAKNLVDGRIWAIKMPKSQFNSIRDHEWKEKEIKNWSKLTHSTHKHLITSNLVRIYEAWEENGYIISSSEYCENGSLIKWLSTRSFPLKADEIWDLIVNMSWAIFEMHSEGILHLDIKPENFMIKDDNTIKLADFGHSVEIKNLNKDTANSKDSYTIDAEEGDWAYVAPELLDFNPKITEKADIFCFGLTLTEIITGNKMPKDGDLWLKIRKSNLSTIYKFPDSEIGNLIDKMWHKNYKLRISLLELLKHPKIFPKFISRLMKSSLFKNKSLIPSSKKKSEKGIKFKSSDKTLKYTISTLSDGKKKVQIPYSQFKSLWKLKINNAFTK